MPCLALGKGLFPAIKTWKSFTIRILQKLHPGKIIKISKTRHLAKAARPRAPQPMYCPSLPSKKRLHRPKHQHRFKKQSLPVFIDELFWTQARDVEEGLPGSSVSVLGGPKGKAVPVARSAVASPHLRGIDARAEEFITRFRAELEKQEIVA